MRAMVLTKTAPIESHPLRLEEVPVPTPGPGEILVRISACGVCRSNLHMIEGDWVAYGVPAKLPIIPGHEIIGEVTGIGPGVDWFTEGDRVGIQPLWSSCGRCEYCLTGREQLCHFKQITGETVDGGYAEFVLAKEEHAYPVPDEIGDVEGAPLFCPGITAYGAISKARLAPGKSMALFGIGGVGHMVLQFARLSGADVIAVGRSPHHLKLAEELGATQTVNSSLADPGETLKACGGVDTAIVFAPSTAVLHQAIKAVKRGGIVVVGVFAEAGMVSFPEEKTIVGSVLGSRQQMREVLQLAAAGKVRATCETFRLEQAEEALRRLKQGEVKARAVLVI
jgi:propanol-preferring alcohol dehydrogenase